MRSAGLGAGALDWNLSGQAAFDEDVGRCQKKVSNNYKS
jgi:hypothetical protein